MTTLSKIILFTTCCLSISCKSNLGVVSSTEDYNSGLSTPSFYKNKDFQQLNDTTFVNLKEYSSDFVYDMKYATKDNFLKTKVYDCAECYLRLKTVRALIDANNSFKKLGYKIKIFDCYRPHDVQVKMWSIVSNPKYVANPNKGSIHNKGGAVDISLVDLAGKEVDMGTPFDFFGEEASHNFINFSQQIKDHRLLLKKIMLESKFNAFESEWWHYNLVAGINDKVSNFKWDCN